MGDGDGRRRARGTGRAPGVTVGARGGAWSKGQRGPVEAGGPVSSAVLRGSGRRGDLGVPWSSASVPRCLGASVARWPGGPVARWPGGRVVEWSSGRAIWVPPGNLMAREAREAREPGCPGPEVPMPEGTGRAGESSQWWPRQVRSPGGSHGVPGGSVPSDRQPSDRHGPPVPVPPPAGAPPRRPQGHHPVGSQAAVPQGHRRGRATVRSGHQTAGPPSRQTPGRRDARRARGEHTGWRRVARNGPAGWIGGPDLRIAWGRAGRPPGAAVMTTRPLRRPSVTGGSARRDATAPPPGRVRGPARTRPRPPRSPECPRAAPARSPPSPSCSGS